MQNVYIGAGAPISKWALNFDARAILRPGSHGCALIFHNYIVGKVE